MILKAAICCAVLVGSARGQQALDCSSGSFMSPSPDCSQQLQEELERWVPIQHREFCRQSDIDGIYYYTCREISKQRKPDLGEYPNVISSSHPPKGVTSHSATTVTKKEGK